MILQLKTPYNPGDADPGKSYTHLHIDTLVYNSTTYMVSVIYDLGTLDANGFYTKGAASPRLSKDTDQSDLYQFATAMSLPNEPILLGAQRLAYQFLVDHCGIQGTVNTQLPNSALLQQLAAMLAAAAASSNSSASSSASSSATAPSTTTSPGADGSSAPPGPSGTDSSASTGSSSSSSGGSTGG